MAMHASYLDARVVTSQSLVASADGGESVTQC